MVKVDHRIQSVKLRKIVAIFDEDPVPLGPCRRSHQPNLIVTVKENGLKRSAIFVEEVQLVLTQIRIDLEKDQVSKVDQRHQCVPRATAHL